MFLEGKVVLADQSDRDFVSNANGGFIASTPINHCPPAVWEVLGNPFGHFTAQSLHGSAPARFAEPNPLLDGFDILEQFPMGWLCLELETTIIGTLKARVGPR